MDDHRQREELKSPLLDSGGRENAKTMSLRERDYGLATLGKDVSRGGYGQQHATKTSCALQSEWRRIHLRLRLPSVSLIQRMQSIFYTYTVSHRSCSYYTSRRTTDLIVMRCLLAPPSLFTVLAMVYIFGKVMAVPTDQGSTSPSDMTTYIIADNAVEPP